MRRIIAVAALTAASACGGGSAKPVPNGAAPVPSAQASSTPKAAYFSVPQEQWSHLQIAPVSKETWSTVVKTTGTVDWDNDHTTQAITQVSGPITRIAADTGTRVKVGDPLLYVASSDMTNGISAYRKAKNRFDLAQHTLDRSKDLFAHKAIAQREMEAAEADYNDAATDLAAALQTLKIFGVDQQEITADEQQNVAIKPELVMHAPLAGTVVQKMVLPGQFIQAGTTAAFVISNTSTVWVQGHVNDKDLRSVHVGDSVDIRNAAFPDAFHGMINYIGDLVDPATRTTSVRIVTQNSGSLLKKDLFVDVVIHDKTTREVLSVPTAAVLYDEENFPFVYIQMSPGKFAQRTVRTGLQQDDNTEIVSGIKAGDQVVAQGSLFLQFANTYQQ